MDERITQVLLETLRVGILRIRAAAFAGRAEECALEADHLHNLPSVIQSRRPELLQYYLTVERPAFERRAPHAEEFSPLWDEPLDEGIGEVARAAPGSLACSQPRRAHLRRRPAQADGSGLGGFQLCGSSSSMREAGCDCTRSSTSAR